jgi:cytochrome c556
MSRPWIAARRGALPRSLLAGLLALLAAPGCTKPLQVRYEEELEAASPPARHAIHSTRLRDTMRRMQQLSAQRLPQAMDLSGERRERAEAVAAAARAIADSAPQIAGATDGVEMSKRARADFLRLAEALRQTSLAVASEAPRLSPEQLETRIHDLEANCTECHSRFRILPRAP